MREKVNINVDQQDVLIKNLLSESSHFKHFACYHSNVQLYPATEFSYRNFDILFAIDAIDVITPETNHFHDLKHQLDISNDWLFGYLGYDLKNQVEKLYTQRKNNAGFPEMYMFRPRLIIAFEQNRVWIEFYQELDEKSHVTDWIDRLCISNSDSNSNPEIPALKPIMTKSDYINSCKSIQEHIQRGDIYEVNFCQEFYCNAHIPHPELLFLKLLDNSPAPFSAFLKLNDKYIISASPERFLKKSGNTIISQPIKGTIKRGRDKKEDLFLKTTLQQSLKDSTENVMIVDIVRNDLSRSAKNGTVKVNELFGVYAFPQVYQMISTITAELLQESHPVDLIKNAFPMGSMTGAPKVRAMEIIDKLEESGRGAYSGSIGYFTPLGDFDFNVIIRTLIYNNTFNYLSCSAGSAITAGSIPEDEYEECLIKLSSIEAILNGVRQNIFLTELGNIDR